MKDLTKVFELNKRIPHQRLLDAAIAEKISKIESRRMVIKRNLETDLNDVQLSIQAIGSLQSVRRIVQIEHMARRAGLIDLVIIAQDVFTSLQQQGKDDLKKHFGMTKKKVMARGDRKNFIMIYNEFVKIKELAEAFEIADIVNEAQYWLENFSSLERLMGVFNEGNDSCTLQYLQAKMDMDKPTFSSFIIDWAGPLGLKIEDNFVRFEKEDLSSAIEKIDEMFAAWKENEISKEKIGRKDTKL
nr:hypothetical protein [Candidatus Sigynarchaeota archaeon]